jgi:hypothetical protein
MALPTRAPNRVTTGASGDAIPPPGGRMPRSVSLGQSARLGVVGTSPCRHGLYPGELPPSSRNPKLDARRANSRASFFVGRRQCRDDSPSAQRFGLKTHLFLNPLGRFPPCQEGRDDDLFPGGIGDADLKSAASV